MCVRLGCASCSRESLPRLTSRFVSFAADEVAQDRMANVGTRVKNIQTQMNIRKWHHEVEVGVRGGGCSCVT